MSQVKGHMSDVNCQMLNVKPHMSHDKSSGIVAIAMIMAIIGILTAIGFFIAIKGGASLFTGQFGAQAEKAQSAAEAGIQDALMKIARDKTISGSYSISSTDWDVQVSITTGSTIIVVATGTASQAGQIVNRVIRAEINVDADGKIINIVKTNI
jgi:hypothetical protein